MITNVKAPAEKSAAIEKALGPFVAAARAESGCLGYVLTKHPTAIGRFLTFEAFADRNALEAHLAASHVKSMLASLKPRM